jgi:REP element-mobilizing transposase RayT
MPHPPRHDGPGSWHHVVNRGIARRTVFESRADVRFFLSRLAHVVRRGWLELHAFAILTTHFHLLVRSEKGRLSAALAWVQNQYVRWFNRRRRRDGPLFRGRFTSRPIRSAAHWRTALAYIDENAVHAGLAREPTSYPWCSATCFARARGPPWLRRDVVEGAVIEACPAADYRPELYHGFATVRIIDADAPNLDRLGDPVDAPAADLIDAAPEQVLEWMRRKARLADGSRPGLVLAPPSAVVEAIRRHAEPAVPIGDDLGREPVRVLECLTAGLLRWTSGSSFDEIAAGLGCSRAKANRLVDEHARRIKFEPIYAELAATLLSEIVGGRTSVRKR